MLKFELFYDNFTPEQVAGLFSPWHYALIVIFALSLALLLYLSRKMTEKQAHRTLNIAAAAVIISEIIKISVRILKGGGIDTWIPLYYCSLFIYAIVMSRAKSELISRTGYAFITMGGILAACLFTLYPSTSLALYPVWHPACLHSFLYHLTMAYCGIITLTKGLFKPRASDSARYGVFVLAACFIGYFLNEKYGSNCMFLHNAFKLPVLDSVLSRSHGAYIAIVVLAQAVLMFWINFGLYRLFTNKKGNTK